MIVLMWDLLYVLNSYMVIDEAAEEWKR
jgi:hypothetical protein